MVKSNADVYLRDENGRYVLLLHYKSSIFDVSLCRRPIDNAWDVVLSNRLHTQAASEISDIFSDGEYLETRQFTVLHKIIIELLPGSLITQLDLSTAQINAVDANGRTCLSWAAARGDMAALNTLLEHGADPRIGDMEGNPPIIHAIKADAISCVHSLMSSTVSLGFVNVFGGTALHVASEASDNPAMLRVLIEEGHIDINAIDYDGDTALNYAARARFDNNTQFLLDAGADPNIANVGGETALHMSIYWNAPGTLEKLVARDVDFKLVNMRGQTLLHAAASHFDSRILKILRRATSLKDVDPHLMDTEGQTCFDLLRINSDEVRSVERVTAFQEFLNGIGGDDGSEDDYYEDAPEYLS